MRKWHGSMTGLTLIEVAFFVAVTAILAASIALFASMTLGKAPVANSQFIANLTAHQCMEWFVGKSVRATDYQALTCGSTPTPPLCTAPAGYTVTATVSCPGIDPSDTGVATTNNSYRAINVTVNGPGSATLNYLISGYYN